MNLPELLANCHGVSHFGPVRGVHHVTMHALRRFIERSGVQGTMGEVLRRLEQWLQAARQAQLKEGRVLGKMLAHGCRAATYYLYGSTRRGVGFILVVEGQTLVTVHRNESGEWRIPEAEQAEHRPPARTRRKA